ncbi:DUF1657 domain-containing protein [Desulforamulus aquiferis]|uniref:DUF1657 domain-containing protein n=1 Tax=Desulforamulus aquiferis TaxID=1397668 RepID=A0AAW7ZEL2_9FIRM|nr:DUF1657 domain-containing protein [Desulforamulus aquiferis]
MTVAAQVKQTVASLKGARATLEAFYSYEPKVEIKESIQRNCSIINSVINDLEKRVKTLEFEEPQYKGF